MKTTKKAPLKKEKQFTKFVEGEEVPETRQNIRVEVTLSVIFQIEKGAFSIDENGCDEELEKIALPMLQNQLKEYIIDNDRCLGDVVIDEVDEYGDEC